MPRDKPQRTWQILAFAIVFAACAAYLGSAASAHGESAPLLSATTPTADVSIGSAIGVTGTLSEAGHGLAGVPLALQADAYPFPGFMTVGQTSTAPDGSFAFAAPPADRNVRLRVLRAAPGLPVLSSATLSVSVDPLATLHVRSLGRGRTQLTLRLRHTEHGGGSPSAQAVWFAAAPGTRVFRLLARTPTRELAPGLTYASAIIDPPSKRFVYRVCLNPAWEGAMGTSASHGRCPRGDYTVGHDVG